MKPLLAIITVALSSMLGGSPAIAAVEASSPGMLRVKHRIETKASPDALWGALGRVGEWWHPQHTWSGSPAWMSIALQAGGCFCERWDGNSVEHGSVVAAYPNQRLLLRAALGPLQAMAVTGLLEFRIEPVDDGSVLHSSYLVSGDPSFALDAIAPAVDGVIGLQTARLERLAATGKADAPTIP